MKSVFIFRILFAGCLFSLWYFCYPETLQHFEEIAFYANIPDYFHQYNTLPQDALVIAGNFLAQFYQYRIAGALLQMVMVLLVVLGMDVIVYRLFKNVQLLWISFLPACYLAMQQSEKVKLEYAVEWVAVVWIIAILILFIRRFPILPFSSKRKKFFGFCAYLFPILIILLVTHNLLFDKERLHYEKLQRIEHAAMNQQWNKVLKELPEDTQTQMQEVQLRYFLLALSETGALGDHLFSFPINDSKMFSFAERNPVAFRFNSIFYWCLGTPNEAIRYAFQENQAGSSDMTFATMRRMVDWYMQRGDIRQAKFYLNILSYTTCHDRFIKTRELFLKQASRPEKQERVFFLNAELPVIAAYLLELNPQDKRALNYILCSFLLDKDLESFYSIFQTYWPQGERIPAHYEEALLMSEQPELLNNYEVSTKKMADYQEFNKLLDAGSLSLVDLKFRNTFWRYMLFTQKEENVDANTSATAKKKYNRVEATTPHQ